MADVGCGCGWSSIAIARGYPNATVIGIDNDEASVTDARSNAAGAGVADRVTFTTAGAGAGAHGRYDLVTCFEALHDMAHPVEALAAMRRMAASGTVLRTSTLEGYARAAGLASVGMLPTDHDCLRFYRLHP